MFEKEEQEKRGTGSKKRVLKKTGYLLNITHVPNFLQDITDVILGKWGSVSCFLLILTTKKNIKKINETLQQNYSSPKNHEDSPPSLSEEEEAPEEEQNENEEEAQEEEEDIQQNKDGNYLFQIPGPPPEVFYSKEDMVKSVKKFAVDHGYVIVIRRFQAEKRLFLNVTGKFFILNFFFSEKIYPFFSDNDSFSLEILSCNIKGKCFHYANHPFPIFSLFFYPSI